jgi:tRNA-specific 2-thiouridylase
MHNQIDKIVVAMSGGVDSCAAALMLKEQGHDIIGVSMQVWDYRKNGGNASRATCCAPSDFDDARIIAEKTNFPYYVFDFEESFHKAVIAPFIDSYLNGLTPNPCLNCNRYVKFDQLRARAKALGAKKVATGHYAQIKEIDSRLGLFTSEDDTKDQSYFLYAMTQQDLSSTLFPVGHMKKPAVRDYLAERGFSVASKAESQDICFVADTAGSFIEKQLKTKPEAGEIIDKDGNKLGIHEGIHNYTVGQRKGLKIAHPHPLYVLNIDPNENKILVGDKEQLEKKDFNVIQVNWISGITPDKPIEALVKLRYRHQGSLCKINPKDNTCHIEFLDSWTAVSPGQAAVFYNKDCETDGSREILGGGIISK